MTRFASASTRRLLLCASSGCTGSSVARWRRGLTNLMPVGSPNWPSTSPAAATAHGAQAMRHALELARQLADDRLVATACRALGNLLMRSNDLAEGIALLEEALSLATAADDAIEAAECCACLAPAFFWQGAIERSRQITMRR